MLKIVLFVLVVQILFISSNFCFGEELAGEDRDDTTNYEELSPENKTFNMKNGDKLYKKKYHSEKEDAFAHKDRMRGKEKKHWESKKGKVSGEKRFAKSDEYDSDLTAGKYVKNSPRNHYENPAKNKGINYHDKTYLNEKNSIDEGEIFEDVKPVSLHHDINVNYIGYHDRKKISSDAEFINVGAKFRKDEGKGNYIRIVSETGRKEVKENFYKNLKEIDLTNIPVTNNSALVARYILHNVDWTAIGTLAASSKIKGGPFVNIISVSDGPVTKSSGVPFFYMTSKDFSSIDLNKDSRCTITSTLAQTDFCKKKNLDPENPLCARLILSGKIKRVKPGTDEEDFAKNALFSRHPEMEKWPSDHNWYFAKLKIWQIILINHFGGATYVNIHDYFNIENS